MKKFILSFLLFLSVFLGFSESFEKDMHYPFGTDLYKILNEFSLNEPVTFVKIDNNKVTFRSTEELFYFTKLISFCFDENNKLISETILYYPEEGIDRSVYDDFYVYKYNSIIPMYKLALISVFSENDLFWMIYKNNDYPKELCTIIYGTGEHSPISIMLAEYNGE